MKEKMGFSLDVPRVYRKVLDQDNTMWLRYDTKEVGYNLIVNEHISSTLSIFLPVYREFLIYF